MGVPPPPRALINTAFHWKQNLRYEFFRDFSFLPDKSKTRSVEAKPKCPPWVNTLIIYHKGVYILWFERVRALSQKGVYKAFAVIFPNNAFQSSLGAFCERLYRHRDIFPPKRNKSNKIIHSGRKHWWKIKNFILLRVDLFFFFCLRSCPLPLSL